MKTGMFKENQFLCIPASNFGLLHENTKNLVEILADRAKLDKKTTLNQF